jgi:hypothetical protein
MPMCPLGGAHFSGSGTNGNYSILPPEREGLFETKIAARTSPEVELMETQANRRVRASSTGHPARTSPEVELMETRYGGGLREELWGGAHFSGSGTNGN